MRRIKETLINCLREMKHKAYKAQESKHSNNSPAQLINQRFIKVFHIDIKPLPKTSIPYIYVIVLFSNVIVVQTKRMTQFV